MASAQDTSAFLTRAGARERTIGRCAIGLLLAIVLVASACSADESVVVDESSTSDAAASTAADTQSDPDTADSSASDGTGSQEAASGGGSSLIGYTAPDGMDASAIALSADGSQVAIGFGPPPTGLATPATIVVYDVASGAEAWRGEIADAGAFGVSQLFFAPGGVGFFQLATSGTELVVASSSAEPIGRAVDSGCAQLLNGAVDEASNALYSVVPGGFCRLDMSSGTAVSLSADAVVPGGVLADSIRFDNASNLVVTVTDGDFATTSHIVDPVTLTVAGSATGEPVAAADVFRDRLVSGVNLSSDSRVAASRDGSVVALLQPDAIEVVG